MSNAAQMKDISKDFNHTCQPFNRDTKERLKSNLTHLVHFAKHSKSCNPVVAHLIFWRIQGGGEIIVQHALGRLAGINREYVQSS